MDTHRDLLPIKPVGMHWILMKDIDIQLWLTLKESDIVDGYIEQITNV